MLTALIDAFRASSQLPASDTPPAAAPRARHRGPVSAHRATVQDRERMRAALTRTGVF